ncbi:MAG: GGDEF domain-containing protein [Chromatiales bacterium 21-64-14]|nr:MAG: GGDEF domain-containing protein [Chromatiales bacterium 21-64-14]HQU14695.1 GGDEF domain-containing protein [Gammaproteobacteria bacterium]
MDGKEVLNLSLIVEPDRQRLVGFAMDAVRALGGNSFAAAGLLVTCLPELREAGEHCKGSLAARLVVDGRQLWLRWCAEGRLLATLPLPPAPQVMDRLAARLREASESVDPELLIRRNRQSAEDLAHLESDLEEKRRELQESIQRAETDSLTGLLNRGAYDARLREVFLRSRRQGEPLALILLDLDKFKEVNDTRGHQFGDGYLRRMAETMRGAVREHVDQACRVGGDEFAIVVSAPLHVAERIGRQILTAMDQKVSIGIAERRADDTIESLIGRTDAALYESKRTGRGRITVADDERHEKSVGGQ